LLIGFLQEEQFTTTPEALRMNLHAMISSATSAVFLAWLDSKAVGEATATTSVGLEYGLSDEMEDLYVFPAERSSGIARALIEEVIAWCKNRSVSTILVTVTPEGEQMHQLLDFYLRQGFTNNRRLIMERSLIEEH
jgi:GNAT superfamily N-acetyltransferase